MLQQKPEYALEHPAVQAVKQVFDARRAANSNTVADLDFDKLFVDLVQSDHVRLAQVAKEKGLSRERLRQIYDEVLRPFAGGKSAAERQHASKMQQNLLAYWEAEYRFLHLERVAPVVQRAHEAGCTVGAKFLKEPGKVDREVLVINGYDYGFRYQKRLWQPPFSNRSYLPADLTTAGLNRFVGMIFRTEPDGYEPLTFVVSKRVLRRVMPVSAIKGHAYLPADKTPPCRKPVVDFRKFIDAWHWVPKPKASQPTP